MKLTKLIKTVIPIAFSLVATASAHALYFGASIGYLIDGEELIYSVRFGGEVAASPQLSHNLELELGFTEDSEFGVRARIMPLMANYRGLYEATESMSVYFGGGLGLSRVSVSAFGASDSDNSFTAQFMVGAEFAFSERVSGLVGYRYVWIDDPSIFGIDMGSLDDNIIELGVRFRF